MQFDVTLSIAIPGMKTSSTTLTVEAAGVREAANAAEGAVVVVALAVTPNRGKPVSVPMTPIELDTLDAVDVGGLDVGLVR